MKEAEITIKQLTDEIGVYVKTLNNYLDLFEIEYKYDMYLPNTNIHDLRSYQLIKDKFYELIISHKHSIIEFEKDYYKWKSIEDISRKINTDLKIVLAYFNKVILMNKSGLVNFQSPYHSGIVFNAFIKFNGIKYEIGHYTNKDKILYSQYENKTLFRADSQLKQISSYEIKKEIDRLELKKLINWRNYFDKK